MYYLAVFLSVAILSFGLIHLKRYFFSFAYATSGLLDCMLDNSLDEEAKQKKLIQKLTGLLKTFGLFLSLLILLILFSLLPIAIYMKFSSESLQELDLRSVYFYLSMLAGSVIPFIYSKKEKNSDYTEWSKLLHRMVLDNYNLSKSLFALEKKIFRKKLNEVNADFLIVTGLARGGTTALTNLLFETQKFHSLSYENMPFLLSVNLWRKLYRPKISKLKQRAHGDNILFGYNSIEALEEYFFKAFLQDKFISCSTLAKHDIDEQTFNEYMVYQKLIRQKNKTTMYLAKNNSLILRYQSLRDYNRYFKIFLIFRHPIEHAFSLLTQHKKFTELQTNDAFILEYMNWLCHHEFGLNHKVFKLSDNDDYNRFERISINYWLTIWLNYYTYVLSLPEDENLIMIDYADLCDQPDVLLNKLGGLLNLNLNPSKMKPYVNRHKEISDVNLNLQKESDKVHNELMSRKLRLSSDMK